MRIKSIRGQNLLCHRVINIDIPQDANVVLVAGPNGSGKSALLEGIRLMRRTAAQTIIRMLTAGLILTLLAGIALKLKLFGDGG